MKYTPNSRRFGDPSELGLHLVVALGLSNVTNVELMLHS